MSQDDEDVKPKLNLNVEFEGQKITVKVKANMPFRKIFEAAEVRRAVVVWLSRLDPARRRNASRKNQAGTLRFAYEGKRLRPEDTPVELDMEDGDQIDAFLQQVGGGVQ
ncbi:hypothetical protein HD554DRAFT_2174252 [Boletus coccyginus]|nr:hypothetical protein HD554DRAFT_2174252 [Boletus coccyginus]